MGFLPAGLPGPDNQSFLPEITEKDYDTELWSVFGQYTHKIGSLDLCLGLRQDEHDTYRDRLSYHAGAVWSASDAWTVKAVHGTAYRTPFARQLLSADEPELEKVSTWNAHVSWEPADTAEFFLGGFVNEIDDHIMEDPYAGLSNRNHQTIKGIEAGCRIHPLDRLELGMNMTFLDNHGPDETYRYNDYSYIRPDGTVVKHYTNLEYPFDTGPESLANLTAEWEPVCGFTVFGRLRYFSSQELIYPRNEQRMELSGEWLLDFNIAARDFLGCGMDLECRVRNAADREYGVPGTYSPIQGEPFTVQVLLSKFWPNQ